MSLASENVCIILFFLVVISGIIIYSFLSFKKLQKANSERLNSLFFEIDYEKRFSLNLNKNLSEIRVLENQTRVSFSSINVEILNLNFSYKEILAKL